MLNFIIDNDEIELKGMLAVIYSIRVIKYVQTDIKLDFVAKKFISLVLFGELQL